MRAKLRQTPVGFPSWSSCSRRGATRQKGATRTSSHNRSVRHLDLCVCPSFLSSILPSQRILNIRTTTTTTTTTMPKHHVRNQRKRKAPVMTRVSKSDPVYGVSQLPAPPSHQERRRQRRLQHHQKQHLCIQRQCPDTNHNNQRLSCLTISMSVAMAIHFIPN